MIYIDHGRGCVRIDGRTLTGLLARVDAALAGRAPDEEARLLSLEEARAAGVLDGDLPAADVAPLLDTIAAPWGQLAVTVRTPDRAVEHRAWVGPRSAVLAVDDGEGIYDLGGLAPTALPAALGRLVRIGPRRRGGLSAGPVAVPAPAFEALASGDAGPLRASLPAGPLEEGIGAGHWQLVSLEAEWSPALTDGEVRHEALGVLDTVEGPLLVSPGQDGAGAVLAPAEPAALWPELVRLSQPPADVDLTSEYAHVTAEPLELRF